MALAWRLTLVAASVVAGGAACSGSSESPPKPKAEPATVIANAPTPPPPALDPSGMHLDDYTPGAAGRPQAKRQGRPIEIMLRSTPPRARVAVDGVEIGTAPQLWQGFTGEHEFIFRLPGHALARYRFHVITTGLVHARLQPVAYDPSAQQPPPEVVPPGSAPSTINRALDGSPQLAPEARSTPPPSPATAPAPVPVPTPMPVEDPRLPSTPGLGPQP